MKAAFACWQERIAPVFDVAREVREADTAGGAGVAVALPAGGVERAALLAGLGVGLLVCGAISRPVQALLEGAGIRVRGFVAGRLDDVMAAWRAGRLSEAAYAMPGCCGRRGRHGGRGGRGGRGPHFGCGRRSCCRTDVTRPAGDV